VKKVLVLRSIPFSRDIRIKKEAISLSKYYKVHVLLWDSDNTSKLDEPSIEIKRFTLRGKTRRDKMIGMPIWWIYIIITLFSEKWNYVHAADFDTFLPAILICKMRRIPIVYDIIDFYADTNFSGSFVLHGLVSSVDKFLMKFADAIILPDESRLLQIGLKNCNKVHFILNSPDECNYRHLINSRSDGKPENTLKLFYGGGVDPDRGIDFLLSTVSTSKDFYLKIMGPAYSSAYREKLYSLYGDHDNISLHLHSVPHETIIKETMKADVIFALYDPYSVLNNRYASPNKLYEAMMCSKPIIVSDDTYMADKVRKENFGLVVPYGDILKLKQALEKLKQSPVLRRTLGENGRKAYESKYNWKIMENRLLAVYDSLEDF